MSAQRPAGTPVPRRASKQFGKQGALVIMNKDRSDGQYYPIDLNPGGKITFGRHHDCDICIKIPYVSRKHAHIVYEDDGVWIVPTSTSEPTELNGETIAEMFELQDNDEIGIGGRLFRYVTRTWFCIYFNKCRQHGNTKKQQWRQAFTQER